MHKIKHIRPVLPGIASTSSVSFAGCGALNFYQTGVAYALQETGQTDRLHFLGASAGAGLAFTTAAGLDAREVAATMAQWITGYGPGRILKPAWAFEVATRFGEHFVNRERFEKVFGAPHGFGNRTSSIHQSSHFTLFIGECTQRGTRRFLLYPLPRAVEYQLRKLQGDGWRVYQQSTITRFRNASGVTLLVCGPSHDPTNV